MLMTHYRQPIDWTERQTENAATTLDGFRHFTSLADASSGRISAEVLGALTDDLNTPLAFTELHRLYDEARSVNWQAACDLKATCFFLGFDLKVSLQEITKRQRGGVDEKEVEQMISARDAARKAKKFAESDRIRDELAKLGVVLKDTKDGTTWEIAR
jgi:cysteinyl-tRNA synthetase